MAQENAAYDPPLFILGSRSKAFNPLLRWLNDWAVSKGLGPTGIEANDTFGEVGARWLRAFQRAWGLDPSGNFDSATRAAAKAAGFDFIAAANATEPDVNMFVQPDGSILWWTPGCAPDYHEEAILGHMLGETPMA